VSPTLRCEAVRWVSDDPFPGWLEVTFTDAEGHLWKVFDKPAVFGSPFGHYRITRCSAGKAIGGIGFKGQMTGISTCMRYY
jgi:hypothetical protein